MVHVCTPNRSHSFISVDALDAESAADMEERLWIEAVRNNTEPVTTLKQAYVVTRILEGVYKSAKTGTIYKFED